MFINVGFLCRLIKTVVKGGRVHGILKMCVVLSIKRKLEKRMSKDIKYKGYCL